jgi:hypothetical protein
MHRAAGARSADWRTTSGAGVTNDGGLKTGLSNDRNEDRPEGRLGGAGAVCDYCTVT